MSTLGLVSASRLSNFFSLPLTTFNLLLQQNRFLGLCQFVVDWLLDFQFGVYRAESTEIDYWFDNSECLSEIFSWCLHQTLWKMGSLFNWSICWNWLYLVLELYEKSEEYHCYQLEVGSIQVAHVEKKICPFDTWMVWGGSHAFFDLCSSKSAIRICLASDLAQSLLSIF